MKGTETNHILYEAAAVLKRILVFGDLHIPTRRDSIPEEFYKHIESSHYSLALVTGDLIQEDAMRKALPPLPSTIYTVVGNMDYSSQYHFHEQIQIGDFGFLLLHGTQLRPRGNIEQLWEILLDTGLDVAIHGHTHRSEIKLHKERLFLNPGTITGATGGWRGRDDASFIELEVNGNELKVILFKTDWSLMKQSEIIFQKGDDSVCKK